jgi:hypothetical protein
MRVEWGNPDEDPGYATDTALYCAKYFTDFVP